MNQHSRKINQEKLFESFPKDRTVPDDWEFDGLKSNQMVETRSKSNDKIQGTKLKPRLDPFPQPRTFPGGWDL